MRRWPARKLPKTEREALEKKVLATVKYPADGKYLGDYKQGERIAQNGVGMQWSDNEKTVNGGNCYDCHQIARRRSPTATSGRRCSATASCAAYNDDDASSTPGASSGTLTPTTLCSQHAALGDASILTEAQIKDVMALLLDPKSPVNK